MSLRELSGRIGRKKSTVCEIVAAGLPADLIKITRRPGSKARIEVPLIQQCWQLAERLPTMLAQQAESRFKEEPLRFADASQIAMVEALERLAGQFGVKLSGKPDSLTETSPLQGKLSGFPDSFTPKPAGFPDSLRETLETVRIPGQLAPKLSGFSDSLGAPIDSKAKPSDAMFDRSAFGALTGAPQRKRGRKADHPKELVDRMYLVLESCAPGVQEHLSNKACVAMLNVATRFQLNADQTIAFAAQLLSGGTFRRLTHGEIAHWGFVTVSFRNFLREKLGEPRPSRKEPSHEGGTQFRDQVQARLKTAAASKKLN